jgi:molybdopterin synthase catalytic subunit/molybdopterin converting factor small subunit
MSRNMADSSKVHVKFFAIFREYVGVKEEWHDIEPGITVQELWNYYTAHAKNPRVGNIRAAFSVNQRLAKPETILNGGEEVGFLPPVSGGAGTSHKIAKRATKKKATPRQRAAKIKTPVRGPKKGASLSRDYVVTKKPLSLDSLVVRVSHPGAGGITTFLGVVRDNANAKAVKFLEYEAYPELAETMLEQIGIEVKERWSDVRIAMAHRVGRLQIGEASVIIAASAPHRAEAFSACRFAIERLKVILPVWKKEFASDTDYWVEGPTAGEVPTSKADEIVLRQEREIEPQNPVGAAANSGEIWTDLERV